jgi:hypothetical protein
MDVSTLISPLVLLQFYKITAELGEVFSFDALCGYVERWRQKRLRIEADQMPVGMSGYSVALRDCDLICFRPGLTRTQRLATRLHEICHLIRGDVPFLSAGERTQPYQQFIKQRDRLALVEPCQIVDIAILNHL